MLRPELIQYAALDALVSAKVAVAVQHLLHIHRKPNREDLHSSTPVRLLPAKGNEPVAYGRVSLAEEKTKLVPSARTGWLKNGITLMYE